MHTFGMPATVGRILGIIYMNRKPMTLTELSEATGMSKTRMSQAVREMLDVNLAEKCLKRRPQRFIRRRAGLLSNLYYAVYGHMEQGRQQK